MTALVRGSTPIEGSPPPTGLVPSVTVYAVKVAAAGLGGLWAAWEAAGTASDAVARSREVSSHRGEMGIWLQTRAPAETCLPIAVRQAADRHARSNSRSAGG